MMPKYPDRSICPRCRNGHIQTSDARQVCDYCGRILWQSPAIVPFSAIAEGERFYCGYDSDQLWVKATPEDRQRLQMSRYMDSYLVDNPAQHSGHGPGAWCIREQDRTMRGSSFTYN